MTPVGWKLLEGLPPTPRGSNVNIMHTPSEVLNNNEESEGGYNPVY